MLTLATALFIWLPKAPKPQSKKGQLLLRWHYSVDFHNVHGVLTSVPYFNGHFCLIHSHWAFPSCYQALGNSRCTSLLLLTRLHLHADDSLWSNMNVFIQGPLCICEQRRHTSNSVDWRPRRAHKSTLICYQRRRAKAPNLLMKHCRRSPWSHIRFYTLWCDKGKRDSHYGRGNGFTYSL